MERERDRVCVCEREREWQKMEANLYILHILPIVCVFFSLNKMDSHLGLRTDGQKQNVQYRAHLDVNKCLEEINCVKNFET